MTYWHLPLGSIPEKGLFPSILVFLFLHMSPGLGYSQEQWGNMHISYIREVENQLFLSDFELGSQETIRDKDGHGSAIGWFFENESSSFFLLDMGYSHTKYKGEVEDGVNVDFKPKTGSGYEPVSQSNNIVYDVDLQFANAFVGISYTNWAWTLAGMHYAHFPIPSTYGVGFISQKARGDVKIRTTEGVDIAEATYKSGLQRYYLIGYSFNIEFIYFSLVFRFVTSPELEVTSCNEEAIGDQACERFYAASGNRKRAGTIFTGGVLSTGMMF